VEPTEATPEGGDPPGGDDQSVPERQAATPNDPILFTIGDIGVSRHWVVTPNGSAPLAGTTWISRDLTRTETKIAHWALVTGIILAIFTCGLGLLLLLVKETRTSGYVEVTVQAEKLFHVTQLPIHDARQILPVRQSVQQAQALAAQVAG
jgi:hypothetical protein